MGSRHKVFSLHAVKRIPDLSAPSHPSYTLPQGAGLKWDHPTKPHCLGVPSSSHHVLREGSTD